MLMLEMVAGLAYVAMVVSRLVGLMGGSIELAVRQNGESATGTATITPSVKMGGVDAWWLRP